MTQPIARTIYLTQLNILKKILDLLEFKFGKDSETFKFLKKQIFDAFYLDTIKLFKNLEQKRLIKRCPKQCSIRQGYTDCECSGSGYINC